MVDVPKQTMPVEAVASACGRGAALTFAARNTAGGNANRPS
jgi:hypothetical protein